MSKVFKCLLFWAVFCISTPSRSLPVADAGNHNIEFEAISSSPSPDIDSKDIGDNPSLQKTTRFNMLSKGNLSNTSSANRMGLTFVSAIDATTAHSYAQTKENGWQLYRLDDRTDERTLTALLAIVTARGTLGLVNACIGYAATFDEFDIGDCAIALISGFVSGVIFGVYDYVVIMTNPTIALQLMAAVDNPIFSSLLTSFIDDQIHDFAEWFGGLSFWQQLNPATILDGLSTIYQTLIDGVEYALSDFINEYGSEFDINNDIQISNSFCAKIYNINGEDVEVSANQFMDYDNMKLGISFNLAVDSDIETHLGILNSSNSYYEVSSGTFDDVEAGAYIVFVPTIACSEVLDIVGVNEGSFAVGGTMLITNSDNESDELLDYYADESANFTIYPSSQPPTSIELSSNLDPFETYSNYPVEVYGEAIYNTGDPVISATVLIQTSEDSWTASLNSSGEYSTIISAPGNSGYVTVTVNDGNLSNSTQSYLTILGGGSGDHFSFYRSTMCKDVQGSSPYDPIDETHWFRGSDELSYCWVHLTDLSVPVRVKWEWTRPDGSTLDNTYSSWTDAGNWDWWKMWSGYYIDGYSQSDYEGRHTVDIFVKEEGGQYEYMESQYYVISYDFREHQMCYGVQDESPYGPINPTNVFYQTDDHAITWSRYTDVSESVEVRTEFYEPDGSLYSESEFVGNDPGEGSHFGSYYQWTTFHIDNTSAADKCGNWTVMKYEKDPWDNWDLLYEDAFQILEDPNLPPEVSISITPENPEPGENVTVYINGSDNAYLQNAFLTWDNGVENSHEWDDIYAGSLNESVNIGSFSDGDDIEVYARIYDTMGNQDESIHHIFEVRSTTSSHSHESTPDSYSLLEPYPNPFNPVTTLSFDLPVVGQVQLVVYDIQGREVTRLINDTRAAGKYSVQWQGKDDSGRMVESGLYFYTLEAVASGSDETFRASRKVLLLK